MLADAGVMLFKGRGALSERRAARLIEVFKESLVDSEILASNPALARLEADLADIAVKLGRPPPRIVVTSHPIGMMAPSDKVLIVSQQELEKSTSRELKALAGHEMAHISRGDHLHFNRPATHTQELAADRLGVELSGEPQAMISWLERRAKEDPLSAHGTLVYPPISKRIDEILKLGKSKATRVDSLRQAEPRSR